MSEKPTVSVVIPLYNKGPHIARTIQSVLNQTEQNFEIVIVDGQSTDDGPGVIKSIKDRRIRFHEQVGSGVSSARNEGVSHASADFIAFLDADDEWMPDHLETLLKLRNMHPNAGAYATAWLIQTSSHTIKEANFHAIPEKPWEGPLPNYFRSAALGDPPVWTSAMGMPKRIFEEMNGFATGAWWGEDTDLWGRIALKYPIAFSWDGMAIYHTEATNRVCNRKDAIDENIFVSTARAAIDGGDVGQEIMMDLQEYIAKKQIETAWANIRAKRPDLARSILKKCETNLLLQEKIKAYFWACVPSSIYELSSRARRVMKG